MPFVIPDFKTIEAALLRDLANLAPELRLAGDSDWAIRAAGMASSIAGLYEHQAWIVRQIFPDTADTEQLENHCRVRGIKRKGAVAAGGTITATGQVGIAIPAGSVLQHADGRRYLVSAPAVIGAVGSVAVSVSAELAGSAGDLAVGEPLIFQNPPLGVAGDAVSAGITGGTEAESDANLLGRLLELIRHPPAGGNKYDFKRWALEVDGVTAAYVYPLRRGLGTVDAVITGDNSLPAPAVLSAVQAHIDDIRPVTGKNTAVIAPTEKLQDITVQITLVSGYTLVTLTSQINALIADYFAALAPGDTLVVNKLQGQITALPGISDAHITLPAANVAPVVDATKVEWLRKGAVTVELM
ncbi:baseplate J/gp47 family protein [Chitinibacter sp. S2-10]|uniref:baseplate J/gp47 family protein n=1 Tax=Chitinibacter sp. S2-10 TaxID=3373597 RepID=UPI003977BB4C